MNPSMPAGLPTQEAQRRRCFEHRTETPDPAHGDPDLLRALLDAMPELCWTAQPDGVIDYHSRRWYEFTGLNPAEAREGAWFTAQPPHLLRAVRRRWRRSIELARNDVAQLIRASLELLEPMAKAHQLELASECPTSLYVRCDGTRIQQVLSHLIGNGMKFTRAGGVIAVRSRATEGKVIVSVSDTGCGISAEQLPHIFEAYWQSDPQPKRGAGLGLSIAHAIIAAHGGRIWVGSAIGVGSTFHFSFPRSNALPASQEQ